MLKKPIIDAQPPSQRPRDKSPEAKLQAVLDTLGKTAAEQSVYCRTQGIYSHHLETWKQEMLIGLGAPLLTAKVDKAQNQKLTNEIKQLKKNIHRKDKALAIAVLVLSPLLNVIRGRIKLFYIKESKYMNWLDKKILIAGLTKYASGIEWGRSI